MRPIDQYTTADTGAAASSCASPCEAALTASITVLEKNVSKKLNLEKR
jgi:hypothetical protein